MQIVADFDDEKDATTSGCNMSMDWTEYRLLVDNAVTCFVIGVVVNDSTINDYYYLRVISPPDMALLTRQTIRVRSFVCLFY